MRVVTVWPGWRTTQAVRAILRTLVLTLARGRWRTWDFTLACLTIAGRSGAVSATWTAPPPMIAPPQVQAQSFARAILTDISPPVVSSAVAPGQWTTIPAAASAITTQNQDWIERKRVNHDVARKCPYGGCSSIFRPNCRQCVRRGESRRGSLGQQLWLTPLYFPRFANRTRAAGAVPRQVLATGSKAGQKCHGSPPKGGEFLTAI